MQAIRAATLALTHSRDQPVQLEFLVEKYPKLLEQEWFRDIYASIREAGDLSLY